MQAALKAIITGDLLVRLGTAMDLKFATDDLLSGRSTLRMLYQEFDPNGRSYNSNTINDVYRLECHPKTPAGLERYVSSLDKLLLRCRDEKPSADMMLCSFYDNVHRVEVLRCDIEDYDRMEDDDSNRTYLWLRRACQRALEQWRAENARAIYATTLNIKSRGSGAAAKKAMPTPPHQS
eukprot:11886539-Heterocapsa_arctica.AAC.1